MIYPDVDEFFMLSVYGKKLIYNVFLHIFEIFVFVNLKKIVLRKSISRIIFAGANILDDKI